MSRPTKSGPDRRSRGYLNSDCQRILKEYVTGEIVVNSLVKMTPSGLRLLIQEVDSLEKEDLPSAGAIGAVFDRWEKVGFATFEVDPRCFIDFTDRGKSLGFDELNRRWKEKNIDSED
jgi:hypothetical protein